MQTKYDQLFQKLGMESQVTYNHLTYADIIQIHDMVIDKYGGTKGIRDIALLESTCKNPYQNVFDVEVYPTILDKAAAYLFYFVNYQIFLDGNKRTGVASCIAFLDVNGIQLDIPQEKLYFLVLDIVAHKINEVSVIAEQLKDYCKFKENIAEYEHDMP